MSLFDAPNYSATLTAMAAESEPRHTLEYYQGWAQGRLDALTGYDQRDTSEWSDERCDGYWAGFYGNVERDYYDEPLEDDEE